jgi:hypothetical protein
VVDSGQAQGIDYYNELCELRELNISHEKGFIVKSWEYFKSGISGIPEYPYLNIPDDPEMTTSELKWKYPEVDYSEGIPGQGRIDKPLSMFNRHFLVCINDKFYDPSYGKIYDSKQQIEYEAIDGYWKVKQLYYVNEATLNRFDTEGTDINGNGIKTDMNVLTKAYLFKKKNSSIGIKIFEDDY